MNNQSFEDEYDKKLIQENTKKQKSDSSKLSIIIFIFSSIYLHYTNNWNLIAKWNTFFYFWRLKNIFSAVLLDAKRACFF